MYDKNSIRLALDASGPMLECIGLKRTKDFYNLSRNKKFNEVVGFCEHLFNVLTDYDKYNRRDEIAFLECSCGKSYLSFVINYLLINSNKDIKAFFWGIDTNKDLIDKCNQIKTLLGYCNMQFVQGSTIDFNNDKYIDIVIALHACDTATDEAIAKGIKMGAKYILVVPCCQNQIRGGLKRRHPLTDLTDFGLLRYKFADILTDALRSQFLKGNGYHVELKEITTIKITPKNMIIIARKKKHTIKKTLDSYNNLSKLFNLQFKLQDFFPRSEYVLGN